MRAVVIRSNESVWIGAAARPGGRPRQVVTSQIRLQDFYRAHVVPSLFRTQAADVNPGKSEARALHL